MPAAPVQVWFDFASPYAYLSAARIRPLADAAGVELLWRPFLLGPIFAAASGGASGRQPMSPPARAYKWRDLERNAARHGVPYRLPTKYPPDGVAAARIALIALREGWGEAWIAACFRAAFVDDRDLADPAVLAALGDALGRDGAALPARAAEPAAKAALRASTDAAVAAGVFGAPAFVVETAPPELFWGDDRLEQALDWATRTA
jgi:2-hydroxychromene-2-carboxylate isomerase